MRNIRFYCYFLVLFMLALNFGQINAESDNSNKILLDDIGIFFSEGDGSVSNPYRVSTIEQLQQVNDSLSSNYILTNDIDASETKNWNDGKGFLPLGSESTPFSGSLNGQNFKIYNISFISEIYDGKENIGLFHNISNVGLVSNLTLEKCYLKYNYVDKAGGIAGTNWGIIENCNVTGNVEGLVSQVDYIGGITGINEGEVFNCMSSVKVIGNLRVGGLVGFNRGVISHCQSSGTVEGVTYTGGLVGFNYGSIDQCYSKSNVKGETGIGGLVGWNRGPITRCHSSGDVSGRSIHNGGGLLGVSEINDVSYCFSTGNVTNTDGHNANLGGLVGFMEGTLSFSYSRGIVNGMHQVGGLVGELRGEVSNCFSTGAVIASSNGGGLAGVLVGEAYYCYSTGSVNGNRDIGGLIGNLTGDAISCYWDIEKSGQTFSDGGIGLSTYLMKQRNTYINSSWSFSNNWQIVNSISYPFLKQFLIDPTINTELSVNSFDFIEDMNSTIKVNSMGCWLPGCENNIEFSINSTDDWIKVTQDGIIICNPTNDNVGNHTFKIGAEDLANSKNNVVLNINIINTNDPPLLHEINNNTLVEDVNFSIPILYTDIDPTNDIIEWNLKSQSDFLSINSSNGILSGLPTNEDVGYCGVVINISDGNGGYDEKTYNFNITNTNDPPILNNAPDRTLTEDVPFSFYIEVSDIDFDDDTFLWSIETNAEFLSYNERTGELFGEPTNKDVGKWSVVAIVTDGNGGYNTTTFNITVLNVNDGPVLNITEISLSFKEDSEYILHLKDIFIDIDGDDLLYNCSTMSNIEFFIFNNSMILTPEKNWSGSRLLELSCSDGTLSVSIDIVIKIIAVNDIPSIVRIIANPEYESNDVIFLSSSVQDPDIPYGDELTFQWISNTIGEIGNDQSINTTLPSGTHIITLIIKDKAGSSVNTTFEITVKEGENKNNGFSIKDIVLPLTIIIFVICIIIFILFFIANKTKPKENPLNNNHEQLVNDIFDNNADSQQLISTDNSEVAENDSSMINNPSEVIIDIDSDINHFEEKVLEE